MSNYTPSTDFASKDALISGNPLKVVKGTEFATEFAAIQAAIATKYDDATVVPIADGGTGASTAATARANLGSTTVGDAVFVAATALAAQQALDLEPGVDVQAYDANTAKLNADQQWTGSQRGTVVTDNDGSFDMAASNNFICTPTAGFTLTFTNITSGQSGNIYLVNGSNYAITAHANTKVTTTLLSSISATGEYWLSYFSPNGTDVLVCHVGDFA